MRRKRRWTAAALSVVAVSASAPVLAVEARVQDRYVGPWHVGMRVNPITGREDHVVSVDDGDYRLAFRCVAGVYSVVLFSRDQTPPFEAGSVLDVIIRGDRAATRTGSARATYPDLLTIEDRLIRFSDIADANVIRVRMRSDAGDHIDAAFDVARARQAMGDFLAQCPNMAK